MDNTIKKTPFYKRHVDMGGRIVEFAGFYMPIQYKGVIKEVGAVRNRIGIFDVSHMGEIKIKGNDRDRFISYITINDPATLDEFQEQYSSMCYEDGGIVDDLLIYKLPDYFFLVVNAANTEKVYNWMVQNKKEDVTIENVSENTAQLAIQGPKAEKYLNGLFNEDISKINYYHSTITRFCGIEMLVSRTGYTGEDGFELYFDPKYALDVWDKLFEEIPELEPCGLSARDILRLEARYCLYGNDIDKTTNPIEAGLSWITKLDKDDFIGRTAILRLKENIKRKLVGFEMNDGIPRKGFEIYKDRERIGVVTSGGYSPTLKKGIGLGYIDVPHHKSGGVVDIKIGEKFKPGNIIKGAFYRRSNGGS
ncbi:glycine cleavage system aminomethyltransferase GcvT [candidate division WOR-3 bacterium]|nr:glycine cleavage system aminomethyltransferase GcvT [candidate division WOR-3 bacterium]